MCINKYPFVTIGIPSYNSDKYIKNCIESILRQTYPNFEIIVSDNGSTDNTEEIVLSFKDPRIKFYRNERNLFCYGNCNRIIGLAKGEFLAIYHSDDVYEPTIVEEQVKFLQTHKGTMAVFTEGHIINSRGEIIGSWDFPEVLSGIDILDFKTAFNNTLKFRNFLIFSSAMFVKRVFTEVGPFKEEDFFFITDEEWLNLLEKYNMKGKTFTANDLEMWLRILQRFPIGILHKKLMSYRIHPNQGTFEHSTGYENFFIVMDYYAGYANKNQIILNDCWKSYETKKIQCEFSKGQTALRNGNFRDARRNFINFIKHFHLLFPLTTKDFFRFLWALSVLLSGPFVIILKKIAQYYLMYRTKRKPKHLKLP